MKPRLLVVELHHLGDAVMSLPFVRGALARYDVHVLCRPASRQVYELLAVPPKIHTWNPPWADEQACSARAAIASARDEGRVLRPLEFAAAVCAWADARVEILMEETGAKRRIGFPMTPGNYYAADVPWRRRRRWLGRLLESAWSIRHPRRALLTDKLHRTSDRQPHLVCWEQLAEALDVTCDYAVPWIKTPDAAPTRQTARPLLAVHARARLPSKQWPDEKWRELLGRQEVGEQFELIELVPPGIEPVAPAFARSLPTPDLPALVEALRRADAVLCHDSLPAHLAAALGKPVVTIFGSGEPDWFAPWQNRARVVQRRVCPLHPCIDRCGMDRYLCLDSIPVSDVLAQLAALRRRP
jgi:ADP-heptose:LPS heptosyltransferase